MPDWSLYEMFNKLKEWFPAAWRTSTSTIRRWPRSCASRRSAACSLVDELVQQSTDVGMIVNSRKTKEMLIGKVARDRPPVTLSGTPVDRALRLSSYWASTSRAISSGASTSTLSPRKLRHGCIFWSNWNAPAPGVTTLYVSTRQ